MRQRTDFSIAAVLLLFVVLGLLYSYYTPVWVPPDELKHFSYCEYIARYGQLPQSPSSGTVSSSRIIQAFHAPLFYFIGSLLCSAEGPPVQEEIIVYDGPAYNELHLPIGDDSFPYHGKARSVRLIRLLSLIFGTMGIFLIYKLVQLLIPGEPATAPAAAVFAALNPEFIHVASSVSNEPLAFLLTTACILLLVKGPPLSGKVLWLFAVGAILGLALLAKISTVFLVPVTLWALLRSVREKRALQAFAEIAFVFFMAAAIAGWWYVLNGRMIRHLDTGLAWCVRQEPFSAGYVLSVLERSFVSFFGCFGDFRVPIEPVHLFVYGLILVAGGAGLILRWSRGGLQVSCTHLPLQVLLLSVGGFSVIFAILNYRYSVAFFGRYFFVVLAPISVGVAVGIRQLIPLRFRRVGLAILFLLLLALNLDIFSNVLRPAYIEPEIVEVYTQKNLSCLSAPLEAGKYLRERFVCSENNLCAIRVLASASYPSQHGNIVFTLCDAAEPDEVLYTLRLPVQEVQDMKMYFFVFPPVMNSRGREYLASFSTDTANTKVSFWCDNPCDTAAGDVVKNNSIKMYLSAYCFIGTAIRSVWEGMVPAVIRREEYVPTNAWELYLEQREVYRLTTDRTEKYFKSKTY